MALSVKIIRALIKEHLIPFLKENDMEFVKIQKNLKKDAKQFIKINGYYNLFIRCETSNGEIYLGGNCGIELANFSDLVQKLIFTYNEEHFRLLDLYLFEHNTPYIPLYFEKYVCEKDIYNNIIPRLRDIFLPAYKQINTLADFRESRKYYHPRFIIQKLSDLLIEKIINPSNFDFLLDHIKQHNREGAIIFGYDSEKFHGDNWHRAIDFIEKYSADRAISEGYIREKDLEITSDIPAFYNSLDKPYTHKGLGPFDPLIRYPNS